MWIYSRCTFSTLSSSTLHLFYSINVLELYFAIIIVLVELNKTIFSAFHKSGWIKSRWINPCQPWILQKISLFTCYRFLRFFSAQYNPYSEAFGDRAQETFYFISTKDITWCPHLTMMPSMFVFNITSKDSPSDSRNFLASSSISSSSLYK